MSLEPLYKKFLVVSFYLRSTPNVPILSWSLKVQLNIMFFFTSFRDPKPNALTHKTFMGEVEILGMSNAHYPRYIVPLSPNALFMWVSFKVQCYFEFDPISYLFFLLSLSGKILWGIPFSNSLFPFYRLELNPKNPLVSGFKPTNSN